jgi:hypothetical protein
MLMGFPFESTTTTLPLLMMVPPEIPPYVVLWALSEEPSRTGTPPVMPFRPLPFAVSYPSEIDALLAL